MRMTWSFLMNCTCRSARRAALLFHLLKLYEHTAWYHHLNLSFAEWSKVFGTPNDNSAA
jgi:hypothetical protein